MTLSLQQGSLNTCHGNKGLPVQHPCPRDIPRIRHLSADTSLACMQIFK